MAPRERDNEPHSVEGISIRDYYDKLWRDHQTMHDRDEAALNVRLHEHALAHEREHAMTEMAIAKEAERNDSKFRAANEWREQSKDQTATYARGDDMQARITDIMARMEKMEATLEAKIELIAGANEKRINILERFNSNMEGRLWAVGAGIGFISVATSILFHFWK